MTTTFAPTDFAKTTYKLLPTTGAAGAVLVPSLWRISAQAAGETVLDTTGAYIAFGKGSPVTHWIVPVADFAPGVLDTVATTAETDDFGSYRCADLIRTDGTRERAVRIYDELVLADGIEPPAGQVARVEWDAVDHWLEEGTHVFGHPRSPFHRLDVRPSARHIVATHGGETIADSSRSQMLVETMMPARFYIPWADVDHSKLVASDTRSWCPYKGEATYFHVQVNGELLEDVVWYYQFPYEGYTMLQDHLAFWAEKLDSVTVDGAPA